MVISLERIYFSILDLNRSLMVILVLVRSDKKRKQKTLDTSPLESNTVFLGKSAELEYAVGN